MKIQCVWNEGMRFTAKGTEHSIAMDAKRPIGTDTGLTPKELVLAAICGCTAMDVASLMKKHRQTMREFSVTAEAIAREGHPAIFAEVKLEYSVDGEVDRAKLVEAVELSQTKYCSVSAMISKAVPIHYGVRLNGEAIHSGTTRFE